MKKAFNYLRSLFLLGILTNKKISLLLTCPSGICDIFSSWRALGIRPRARHEGNISHPLVPGQKPLLMKFGLEKCAKARFKKGKLTSTGNIVIDVDTEIRELDQEGVYKYLGVDESDGIQHSKMKEKIRKEYKSKIYPKN